MKPQLNIFSRCCRENAAISGLYMQGLKGNGQLMVLLSVWFSAFVSVHLISRERCLWFTKLSCPFFFIPFFSFLPFELLVSICYMLGMKYEGDKWWFSQFITYGISSGILDFCGLSILEWTWQCNMTRLLASSIPQLFYSLLCSSTYWSKDLMHVRQAPYHWCISLASIYFFLLWDEVSLIFSGCLWTHCVVQGSFTHSFLLLHFHIVGITGLHCQSELGLILCLHDSLLDSFIFRQ